MLGVRLKKLRRTRNLTQQQLGEMLGISASAVGMYEQGRREPDHEMLAQLCKLFGVSSDYFLLEEVENTGSGELELILDEFRSRLLAQDSLMFNGVPLSDEDIAQVLDAIEVGTMIAMKKMEREKKKAEE
ncbi:MAG: helix-turn-helix transcriptional regulator [Anaerotruncus sp.]|nr:helix-turn-helix transcriptional regulator [Anaerotruncus sp.]